MKILVYSDLHLEFGPFAPPHTDADVVVLGGDIASGQEGLAWARQQFGDTPIVYVLGNHEFYGAELEDVVVRTRSEALRLGVAFLDCDSVTVDSTRLLGATLWTDFEVDTERGRSGSDAMRLAQKNMHDYAAIRNRDGTLTPQATQEFHRAAPSLAKPAFG
jgi:hypothetical protein